jgi:hypothetical protein
VAQFSVGVNNQGLIRNEGFRRWHQAAEDRARRRRSMDAIASMIEQGLEKMDFDDDAQVEVSATDQEWDRRHITR